MTLLIFVTLPAPTPRFAPNTRNIAEADAYGPLSSTRWVKAFFHSTFGLLGGIWALIALVSHPQ